MSSARSSGLLTFARAACWPARLGLCLALLGGCTSGNFDTPIELSWRFVDDRDCDLTGVSDVLINGAGPTPVRAPCRAGLAPDASFELVVAERPATLTVAGHTISGAALYVGELAVAENSAESRLVTLRFTGGRNP